MPDTYTFNLAGQDIEVYRLDNGKIVADVDAMRVLIALTGADQDQKLGPALIAFSRWLAHLKADTPQT